MAFGKTDKEKVISDNKLHERDTGSAQVQIALITERVTMLTDHFKVHKKDHHSRFGLVRLVNQRRRLLNYLERENPVEYEKLIKKLKLRK
ncbi:MAG: 30S ribosomal protein S15 [Candidatus Omnitrophota bacterium]